MHAAVPAGALTFVFLRFTLTELFTMVRAAIGKGLKPHSHF